MARIGVFVCWCGVNISGTVDVERVAEEAQERIPNVVYATDYKYMCSDPGQLMVVEAIKEHRLTGVVVASCSPRMHEVTFQKACLTGGLNPYCMEMANIREQDSWVHKDREEATTKALELIWMKVAKVAKLEPLFPIRVPVTKKALVIGGGVAGIQAALDIAEANQEVILVEKEPSIGGHMAQLDETFPTLDCSQCILTPKMVQVVQHEKIKLYSYAEIESVSGYVGNFVVKIKKKPRGVDTEKCTGCGVCVERCPVKKIPSEFNAGIGFRSAIYIPFPQAVPNWPVIDQEHCTYYKKKKCGLCQKECTAEAVIFDTEPEFVEEEVGTIVVATGCDPWEPVAYGEYGYGIYPDVVTSLQFERMTSASGPTSGVLKRPSDGEVPKEVAFIQCVGSRDNVKGYPYCSRICCMYTAKHAIIARHKANAQSYVFYIDVRAGGKGYEEFIRRAQEEDGARYIRGKVSRVYQDGKKLVVRGEDTLLGRPVELEVDMVVLASAIKAKSDAGELARKLNIAYDQYEFYTEAHPKLRPVDTNSAGVFLAGTCQSPKDIPDTVSQASAAASKALAILSARELTREPLVAEVDPLKCAACFSCQEVCTFNAIEEETLRSGKKVSKVNEGLCLGCGVCVSACRNGALSLKGFTDDQIYAEVAAL